MSDKGVPMDDQPVMPSPITGILDNTTGDRFTAGAVEGLIGQRPRISYGLDWTPQAQRGIAKVVGARLINDGAAIEVTLDMPPGYVQRFGPPDSESWSMLAAGYSVHARTPDEITRATLLHVAPAAYEPRPAVEVLPDGTYAARCPERPYLRATGATEREAQVSLAFRRRVAEHAESWREPSLLRRLADWLHRVRFWWSL